MKKICIAICLSWPLMGMNASAQAGKAHVHGNAAMEVVVDGKAIEIRFESPLDSLIGFEHAPRTEKQKKAVQAMEERFRQPETLFVPTAEARCSASPAEVSLPFKADAKTASDHQEKETHSDMEATIRFNCENPAALKGMEVRLFGAFPGLKRVDAQAVSERGQSAARLTPRQRNLQW